MTAYHIGTSGSTYYGKPMPPSSDPSYAADILTMSEIGTTGVFVFDTPHDSTKAYAIYLQAGASPASSDKITDTLSATDSAAIAAILEDTGTTLPAAIAAIEGGGGGSVNVLPAVGIVADRSPGVTLTPVVGELISQSITLYATDGTTPINLIGKTLAIPFETLQGVDVAVIPNASITVSGTSNNVVTFAYPSAVTSSERTLRFAIKDASSPFTEYLKGICAVTSGPRVDA